MPENSNEERREILAYLTEEPPSEQHSEGRYFLRYERNMVLDRLEEPSADPRVAPSTELSKDQFYELEDRLGYQGIGSGTRKDTSVYGMRTTINPDQQGMDAVDWVGAEPSILDQHGQQNDWNQTAASQMRLRFEATEYDQRGALPEGWTPQSARVGGNRPGVDAWKDIRNERWPVGEDGRRRPADQQVDASQDAQSQEQSMGNVKGPNSQAGLSAHVGGARVSLPSVPPPGEPGSRFNPIVRDRQAQGGGAAPVHTPGKSLPKIGAVPIYSKRDPSQPQPAGEAAPTPPTGDVPIYGPAAGAAARGSSDRSRGVAQQFTSGFSNGLQSGLSGASGGPNVPPKPTQAPSVGQSSTLSNWIQDEATREQEDLITEVPEEIMNPKPAAEIKKSGPGSEPREPNVSKTGIRLAPGARDDSGGPEHEAGR